MPVWGASASDESPQPDHRWPFSPAAGRNAPVQLPPAVPLSCNPSRQSPLTPPDDPYPGCCPAASCLPHPESGQTAGSAVPARQPFSPRPRGHRFPHRDRTPDTHHRREPDRFAARLPWLPESPSGCPCHPGHRGPRQSRHQRRRQKEASAIFPGRTLAPHPDGPAAIVAGSRSCCPSDTADYGRRPLTKGSGGSAESCRAENHGSRRRHSAGPAGWENAEPRPTAQPWRLHPWLAANRAAQQRGCLPAARSGCDRAAPRAG